MRRILVVLAVLVVLALVTDRVALLVAEHAVADRLSRRAGVSTAPDVAIAGFPFLTQVAAGSYQQVDVTFRGVDVAGRLQVSDLEAHAREVHAAAGDVIGGRVSQLRAGTVDATATVAFDRIDQALALRVPRGLVVRTGPGARPDELDLRVTVQGRTVGGRVRLAVAGGRLRVSVPPNAFPGLPAGVVTQVRQVVAAGLALPELPFGLMLASVRTGPAGVRIDAGARDVALAG